MIEQLSEKTMKGMKEAMATQKGGKPKPRSSKQNGQAATGEQAKQEQPSKKPKRLDGIYCKIYQKAQGCKPLTVEEAMELIGWEVVEDGPFHIKDLHGNKIRLRNNSTNRPFRPGLAGRYRSEIIRGKWRLNGESIIFDWDRKCQSGQHRLVGFILAEQQRRKEEERYRKYWKGPITIECLVVFGIDPKPEVVDTIDQGQKRTPGDVLYRSEIFGDGSAPVSLGEGKDKVELPVLGPKLRQKLSNILAGAARLAWLRCTNRNVSDAPHFPVTEMMDFIHDHPGLVEATARVYVLEGGDSKSGQKISRRISLGYAAALMYLMSVSSTDPDEWEESGAAAVDYKMKKKALEFWSAFASGANMTEEHPIHLAREIAFNIDKGSAIGRDEVVGTIVRAYNCFVDGRLKVKSKDVSIGRSRSKKTGKEVLVENPRLGGIDTEGAPKRERDEGDDVPETNDTEREGMRVGKNWAEGDTCWVKPSKGDGLDPWFGTIREIIKVEKGVAGGDLAMVEDDTGDMWEQRVSQLFLKYPG